MDNTNGDIIIYQTDDGLTKIDVKVENETVWLSQQQMAEASFENSLRMSGMNEEAIKNIEQKIANVETKMYDFFDKGIGKLDKLVDKWNDYIENTKNEKKGVEDGKDER